MQTMKTVLSENEYNKAVKKISNISESRIKEMDECGIDIQVLSLTSANMELLQRNEAIYYSKLSNDILAIALEKYPTRFKGFCVIPSIDPIEASKELERCMNIKGFVGVIINGHINCHYLDEKEFEPFLAKAEKLNAPIYIHPAIPPKSVIETSYNLEDNYAKNVLTTGGWGWHIETGTHVLIMIVSSVFDRHPNLKVIIGHLGEELPFFIERLYNATNGKLKKPFHDYLRENIYYIISGFNFPNLLEYVLKEIPSDHTMFSCDYSFSSQKLAVEFIDKEELSSIQKEKIAYQNA